MPRGQKRRRVENPCSSGASTAPKRPRRRSTVQLDVPSPAWASRQLALPTLFDVDDTRWAVQQFEDRVLEDGVSVTITLGDIAAALQCTRVVYGYASYPAGVTLTHIVNDMPTSASRATTRRGDALYAFQKGYEVLIPELIWGEMVKFHQASKVLKTGSSLTRALTFPTLITSRCTYRDEVKSLTSSTMTFRWEPGAPPDLFSSFLPPSPSSCDYPPVLLHRSPLSLPILFSVSFCGLPSDLFSWLDPGLCLTARWSAVASGGSFGQWNPAGSFHGWIWFWLNGEGFLRGFVGAVFSPIGCAWWEFWPFSMLAVGPVMVVVVGGEGLGFLFLFGFLQVPVFKNIQQHVKSFAEKINSRSDSGAGEGWLEQLIKIKEILSKFGLAYGETVNFQKSEIMFSPNVEGDLKECILQSLLKASRIPTLNGGQGLEGLESELSSILRSPISWTDKEDEACWSHNKSEVLGKIRL
ncbi:hypothetical protein RHMOL_Rhmol12G0014100 [Rhododendron molle]|uniref:Uncharacterized protein n=1 Tax=Rhododendron molle TaxID=49168 RepID=A0ACC0LEA8_RHOML|nr:hypothetical protein RHMOL_Rhmol12G0014100 [Rhododendron molle]